jgi:hypothetical protein
MHVTDYQRLRRGVTAETVAPASVPRTQAGRHTDLLRARSGSAFTKWKWGVGLSYGVKSYTLR